MKNVSNNEDQQLDDDNILSIERLLEEASRPGLSSHELYKTTRGLVQAVSKTRNNNVCEGPLFSHVFRFVDFATEVVGFACASLLAKTVAIHLTHCEKCKTPGDSELCPALARVFTELIGVQKMKKCRANALFHFIGELPHRKVPLDEDFLIRLYNQIDNAQITRLLLLDMSAFPERNSFHLSQLQRSLLSDSQKIRHAAERRHIPAMLRSPILSRLFFEKRGEFMAMPSDSPHSLEAKLAIANLLIFHQNTIPVSLPKTLVWSDFFSDSLLREGLASEDPKVKIAAWTLLADHPKTLLPCTQNELRMAGDFVAANMALSEPVDRKQMFLMLKRLMHRLHEHARVVLQHSPPSSFALFHFDGCYQRALDYQTLVDYYAFFSRLSEIAFDTLREELAAEQAVFSRRISALGLLELVYLPPNTHSDKTSSSVSQTEQDTGSSIRTPPFLREFIRIKEWMTREQFSLILRCLDGEFEFAQRLALRICRHQAPFVFRDDSQKEEFFATFLDETKRLLIDVLSVKMSDEYETEEELGEEIGEDSAFSDLNETNEGAGEELNFSTVFGSALYQTIRHRLAFAFDSKGDKNGGGPMDFFEEILILSEQNLQQISELNEKEIGESSQLEPIYRRFLALRAVLDPPPESEENPLENPEKEGFLVESFFSKKVMETVASNTENVPNSFASAFSQLLANFGSQLSFFGGNKSKKSDGDQTVEETIVEEFSPSLAERIVSLCLGVSALVEPIVHSLTPEGYFPEFTMEDKENLPKNGPKWIQKPSNSSEPDSLDFGAVLETHARRTERCQRFVTICWRLHASISALLAQTIQMMPSARELPPATLTRIGQHFWRQLTACRHCGAFEAAADAFEMVCRRFWQFSAERAGNKVTEEMENLSPARWLQQILQLLLNGGGSEEEDHGSDDQGLMVLRRCGIGRRSAGIPHLIHAIAITEPAGAGRSKPGTEAALRQLLNGCCPEQPETDEATHQKLTPEFQVHCVNVLRRLFTSSALAETVVVHAERAFRAAIAGTASTDWRLRNAHNQLFAALVRRVFGTPDTVQQSSLIPAQCRLSAAEFFSRYPSLYELLREKLRATAIGSKNNQQLSSPSFFDTFSVLVLLTHLHPSTVAFNDDGTESGGGKRKKKLTNGEPSAPSSYELTPFAEDLIRVLFTARAAQTRKLAAAALVTILRPPELVRVVAFDHRQVDTVVNHHEPGKPPDRKLSGNTVDALLSLLSALEESGAMDGVDFNSPKDNPGREILAYVRRLMYELLRVSAAFNDTDAPPLARYCREALNNSPALCQLHKKVMEFNSALWSSPRR